MDLRLAGCCAGALLLHGALLALASLPGPAPAPLAVAFDEAEVELLESPSLPPPPPPEATPPSSPEPPERSAPPPRVARATAQRRPSATPAPLGTEAASELAAVPDDPENASESGVKTSPPRKSLSPAELGLGVGRAGGSVFLDQMRDAPPPAKKPDVGGVREALMARDTRLGLGPGGAVAAAVRGPALELAPLNSEATISVDLNADGSVAAIFLEQVSSYDREWSALVSALRGRLKALSARAGRPLRVRLLVTNRSTLRAGNPASPLQFDLSNIGSPTMQSLHVRVLTQAPL